MYLYLYFAYCAVEYIGPVKGTSVTLVKVAIAIFCICIFSCVCICVCVCIFIVLYLYLCLYLYFVYRVVKYTGPVEGTSVTLVRVTISIKNKANAMQRLSGDRPHDPNTISDLPFELILSCQIGKHSYSEIQGACYPEAFGGECFGTPTPCRPCNQVVSCGGNPLMSHSDVLITQAHP